MPDIVTSKTFVDGEKGITAAKLNQIISGAVIQPGFYNTKPSSPTLDPTDVLLELKGTGTYAQITGAQIASSVAGNLALADTTQNGMLRKVSGLTTDFVDGTNNCQDLASGPAITAMRLRSFNAVGNPNFEVDQRNAGAALTNPVGGTLIQDRWEVVTGVGLTGTVNTALQTGLVLLPGTNFALSNHFQRLTVGTSQAALAGTHYYGLRQNIEGPRWRELSSDVHSISLLVRSSVAGLIFTLILRDQAASHCLLQLCTIPTANTWTLIPLPNLAIWSASATFSAIPGQVAYYLDISLASGSTYLGSAGNTWQNGALWGGTGMSNFLATSGATFDLAFVQHEPGPNCTTFIDCPFTRNLDDCLRYYCKSNPYFMLPWSDSGTYAQIGWAVAGGTIVRGNLYWPKPMAKTPVLTFSYLATPNNVYVDSINYAVTYGSVVANEKRLGQMTLSTAAVSPGGSVIADWYSDTGW